MSESWLRRGVYRAPRYPSVDDLERMTPDERERVLGKLPMPPSLREDLLDELEEDDW